MGCQYCMNLYQGPRLIGCFLFAGWIDQSNISCIPSFLRMEFAVALCMRDATDDEWDDCRNMFARSVRHMHAAFGRLNGWPGKGAIYTHTGLVNPCLLNNKAVYLTIRTHFQATDSSFCIESDSLISLCRPTILFERDRFNKHRIIELIY